jgi:glutamate carboxypeptidase
MSAQSAANARARALLAHAESHHDAMVDLLVALASMESPTDDSASQGPVQDMLAAALEDCGMNVRHVPGRGNGGHLWAVPEQRGRHTPAQLLIGHTDTVWPVGTLEGMPVVVDGDVLRGPGTFDMKAGLTQIVFALKALNDLGLEPPATPVVFINSDEETGSPESKRWVSLIARRVCRAFVPEPALGEVGRLKTARRGIAQYLVTVHGKAAHSGLDPLGGASAIEELSRLVQQLHAFSDHDVGLSVNVGTIRGGTRPNVIAAHAEAEVDVRMLQLKTWRELHESIRALTPETPGTRIEITGGLVAPPMEKTPRNRRLWAQAQAAGERLGLSLEEDTSGGGSDGNTTSQFTATLDGLGAVGDGAHAHHEHLSISHMIQRTALLAELLMAPVEEEA